MKIATCDVCATSWEAIKPRPCSDGLQRCPKCHNSRHYQLWIARQPKRHETTALEAFEKLVAAAAELDRVLGLTDCEDPAKAEWLDSVRERVHQHELANINKRLSK
jgi:hypothetical protein